jgi:DNA-binding XRE family transcriptional regulator
MITTKTYQGKIVVDIDGFTGIPKELIVGKCAKIVRNIMGLTQKEMAKLIGIHQVNLSLIETGKSKDLNSATLVNLKTAAEVCQLHFCRVVFEDALGKIASYQDKLYKK